MMQGITALPGAQQPQNPGQAAPVQALPAAQPKTPASEIAPYEGMDLQRLVAAFQQRPSGPLLGLITKKAEAEKLQQQMEQQQAMGAYAQQGPQTVKDMALANAMQVMQPTQVARHGGVMHGYSGGGAVAFQEGGSILSRLVNEPWWKVARDFLAEQERGAEEYEEEQRKKYDPYRSESRQLDVVPPSLREATPVPATERLKDTRQTPPPSTARSGAPAPATQPPTGLGALIAEQFKRLSAGENPEIVRIGKEAEKSAQDTAALLQRMQSLSPEEAAARAQYYKTVEGAYEPQRKSLEAARASTREGLLQSPEALARLAAAFGGAKRVGQGLSAAAGAAGEVLGERRKRAEQLEERYQTLSSQLAITTAQAQRADVEGDEKRKRELMLQAQGLKDRLLATQMDLLKTSQGMRAQDIAGIAALTGTQAQMMQAGKPTAQEFLYNLYRKDPKAFEGFLTAQQGPKSEAAERTAMLRALVTEAVKNPLMFQQLPPEMKAIVQQEMLKLGVTSALPSGANVRE